MAATASDYYDASSTPDSYFSSLSYQPMDIDLHEEIVHQVHTVRSSSTASSSFLPLPSSSSLQPSFPPLETSGRQESIPSAPSDFDSTLGAVLSAAFTDTVYIVLDTNVLLSNLALVRILLHTTPLPLSTAAMLANDGMVVDLVHARHVPASAHSLESVALFLQDLELRRQSDMQSFHSSIQDIESQRPERAHGPLDMARYAHIGTSPGTCVVVVIPWIVIQELDRMKTNEKLRESAAQAISFILACLRSRHPFFRGQSLEEMKADSKAFVANTNDDKILQCCLHFRSKAKAAPSRTILLSNDKNLNVKAIVNDVDAFTMWDFPTFLASLSELKERASQSTQGDGEEDFAPGTDAPSPQHGEQPPDMSHAMVPAMEAPLCNTASGSVVEKKPPTAPSSEQGDGQSSRPSEFHAAAFESALTAFVAAVTPAIVVEFQSSLGDLWQDVMQVKPPWTASQITQMLIKKKIGVFSYFPIKWVEHVEALDAFLKHYRSLPSPRKLPVSGAVNGISAAYRILELWPLSRSRKHPLSESVEPLKAIEADEAISEGRDALTEMLHGLAEDVKAGAAAKSSRTPTISTTTADIGHSSTTEAPIAHQAPQSSTLHSVFAWLASGPPLEPQWKTPHTWFDAAGTVLLQYQQHFSQSLVLRSPSSDDVQALAALSHVCQALAGLVDNLIAVLQRSLLCNAPIPQEVFDVFVPEFVDACAFLFAEFAGWTGQSVPSIHSWASFLYEPSTMSILTEFASVFSQFVRSAESAMS